MIYKRCIGCGNFFLSKNSDESEFYCSIECSTKFVRCSICGNYLQKENEDDSEPFVCCEKFIKEFRYKRKTSTIKELIL